MTTKKSDYADIEPNKLYSVTLTTPITVGGATIRPDSDVTLKGKVIKEQANGVVIDIVPAAD